jgi:hypothetical protein
MYDDISKEMKCEDGYFTSMFSSFHNNIALTSTGKCYRIDQLGQTLIPSPITNVDYMSMSCGIHHTLLLASNGKCYGFGSNFHGPLGLGHNKEPSPDKPPVELPINFRIDLLMNQINPKVSWEIERLLWMGKIKNDQSNLSLLPSELIVYLKNFL